MDKLEQLTAEYRGIIRNLFDYEKYNQFAISHHSTVIEGNTLTEIETQVFLDEGLTAKGKPLVHHLMVKDHLEALQFVIGNARQKTTLSQAFIRQIGAHVMKNTGSVYNTALGTFDSSKGDLRLVNVTAGIGGKSYMNYSKVENALKELCSDFGIKIAAEGLPVSEVNDLAFLIHYQFVTIHPFVDGNGRTGRLLMNFVQAYHDMPMTIISSVDKGEYIRALTETRQAEDIDIFLQFMRSTHIAFLENEIKRLSDNKAVKKNIKGFRLLF